ncbi:MAG: hypothetical protein KC425_24750, partial [Anaerolineales bacterium]|nr:hypothetical protein [Anaerolineales bacterium]
LIFRKLRYSTHIPNAMNDFPQSSGIYERLLQSRGQRYTLAGPAGYAGSAAIALVIATNS